MTRTTKCDGARAMATGCFAAGISLVLVGCGSDFSDADPGAWSDDTVEEQGPSPVGTLDIELSPVSEGTGRVRYVLTNTGDETLRFLRRDTALEASLNMFDVRLAGEPVPFVGPHVYWADVSAEDYEELEPRTSVEVTVDLAKIYAMTRAGQYTVQARRRHIGILGADTAEPASAVVEGASEAFVSVDDVHVHRAPDPSILKFRNYAETCSSAELQDMVAAETVALRLALLATAHLNQIPFDGDIGGRYAKWFGDPARDWNDVRRAETILTRARNSTVGLPEMQFTCRRDGDVVFVDSAGNDVGCGASVDRQMNAATNGNLGTTVHVCPSFLAMSTRAMASVMIHEASHHYGTDDFVSSAAAALSLAITAPADAAQSAENYEQYVLEF